MKKLKNRKTLIASLAIIGTLLITAGASFAFFSYSKTGLGENTISSGAITFHYQEGNRTITLQDVMPMTDAQGKAQNNYFDFEITAKSGEKMGIPYTVTARMASSSTLDPNYVKVYLSDQSDNEIEAPRKYGSLTQYTNSMIDVSSYTEKIIYQGQVPSQASNYRKDFRVRMWVSDDYNLTQTITGSCSDTTYTTQEACEQENEQWTNTAIADIKTFKLTFNVYAEGSSLDQSQLDLETSNNINVLGVNNVSATYDTDTNTYSAVTSLTAADFDIQTEYPDATVTVEKTDSTYTNVIAMNNGIQKLSTKRNASLTAGNNYFRITVTPASRGEAKIYKLVVASLTAPQNCIDGTLCVNYYDDNYNLVNNRDDGTIAVMGGSSVPYHTFAYNFDTNTTIKKVIISGSVKEIGKEVLTGDTVVEELILEEGIEKISNSSFKNMKSLIKISVPNSLTNISKQAFLNVSATANVNIYDNGKYIGNASNPYLILVGTTSNKIPSLNINTNTKFIGDSSIYSTATTFTSLTIPGNVKQILSNAIKGSNITNLVVEEGVEDIGEQAFNGIRKGANVSLPNSVKNVARNFLGAKEPTYTIYDNGYYIGNSKNPYLYLYKTDSNCTDSIIIHPDTEFLGQSWYSSCSNLRSITIPSKVRFISASGLTSAFENITFESAANWKAYSNDYNGTYINSAWLLGNFSLPSSPTNVRDLMGSSLEKYWIKD